MPPTDERVPGESDDEELPPAAGPSAPGPSFLDATDTTVIRIDDSPLVLPPSVEQQLPHHQLRRVVRDREPVRRVLLT